MQRSAKTAGIIVIGNEVLSGKVSDINSTWLIAELRPLGVRVARVVMIPDEIPVIVDHVRSFSTLFDVVFTTGGVGPTHDDKTFEAVAAAFEAPLEGSDELARVIREYFKDTAQSDLYMRMSFVPRGTELVWTEGLLFPVTKIKNVYVMPGDPKVMRKKFTAIKERFREAPFEMRRVFTTIDEGPLAALMGEIERTMGVEVGSYPVYDNCDYKVQITLESKERERVEAALARLLSAIPPEHIHRIE